MNRKTAGIVFMMGVGIALAGTASAQNSPGSAALDTSLREAVARKDVPGVVALVTDRERVLIRAHSAWPMSRPAARLRQMRYFVLPR